MTINYLWRIVKFDAIPPPSKTKVIFLLNIALFLIVLVGSSPEKTIIKLESNQTRELLGPEMTQLLSSLHPRVLAQLKVTSPAFSQKSCTKVAKMAV